MVKTIICTGVMKGEKCLFISHEEPEVQLREYLLNMASSDKIWDIEIISEGVIQQTPFQAYDWTERLIEKSLPVRFLIDGLTALKHAYSEEDFQDIIRSIVNVAKQYNVTLMMTLIGNSMEREMGVSTLADNILALTLERNGDRIVRRIGVIKARGSRVDNVMKVLRFTAGGKMSVSN